MPCACGLQQRVLECRNVQLPFNAVSSKKRSRCTKSDTAAPSSSSHHVSHGAEVVVLLLGPASHAVKNLRCRMLTTACCNPNPRKTRGRRGRNVVQTDLLALLQALIPAEKDRPLKVRCRHLERLQMSGCQIVSARCHCCQCCGDSCMLLHMLNDRICLLRVCWSGRLSSSTILQCVCYASHHVRIMLESSAHACHVKRIQKRRNDV